MSVKHVEDYFSAIATQYCDMLEALRDMEDECNNGMVEPERIDALKDMIKPIRDNYMTWSYVMYLMGLPNRKGKRTTVSKQLKKKIDEYQEYCDKKVSDSNDILMRMNNDIKSLNDC